MDSRLSVVIDTLNEADELSRCLESIKDIASEIVICDQGSTDNTLQIAKQFKAKVVHHKRVDYVELIRNFEVGMARGEWILILDPDEEVPVSLAKEISEIVKNPQADHYYIPRKNVIFGRWMLNSRWWPDLNLRLFKRGTVTWTDVIHKQPLANGKGINLKASEDLAIIHHHYHSIDQYLERMNRYTTQQAKSKLAEGYIFKWEDLITKPVNEFLSRYFFGNGYKDGIHGLAVSMLQGFSELVLYLKVWQLSGFEEKQIDTSKVVSIMSNKERDLHYWQNDALYRETGSLTARIKRKLRI